MKDLNCLIIIDLKGFLFRTLESVYVPQDTRGTTARTNVNTAAMDQDVVTRVIVSWDTRATTCLVTVSSVRNEP